MYTKTIINPKTNRKTTLRCWNINPRAILDKCNSEKITAREISWMLLNDDQSIQTMTMQAEEYGDCANMNFSLACFEQALDWRLGIATMNVIRSILKQTGKLVKPFEIGVSRKGDIFAIFQSGHICFVL